MSTGAPPGIGPLLRQVTPAEALACAQERGRGQPDLAAQAIAREILEDVRNRGAAAVRAHAVRFGDLTPEQAAREGPLCLGPDVLHEALAGIPDAARQILEMATERIHAFAMAQRRSYVDFEQPMPGGAIGQSVLPVERAGCYAPGGRYPLPSSVLMTAVTARAAGVREIIVASPRPAPITLAAAALAGASAVLPVGGVQAIAALACGAGDVPRCDAVVGPGNRFVTAAKQLIAGSVAIDMLAGPSELLILADDSASPRLIAADLLAQAEHDDDALPWLITTSTALAEAVLIELAAQLETLPTAATARRALQNGWMVSVTDLAEAAVLADALAPEHLEVMTRDAAAVAARLNHYGALFIGAGAAEVLGDYGLGPNHVLPTGGAARQTGGLSVATFLRVRTFIRMDAAAAPPEEYRRAAGFARLEGLEAHARSAEGRLLPG